MQRILGGFGLGLTLAVASLAYAAPLNLKQVSDDAKWVGHVDFDALRDSVVVKKAMEKHLAKHKNAETHLKMVQGLIGMDPRKDLHGATFYGNEIGKHEGVMILHANLDQKKLQGWAEKIPGREATEHGSYKISSWTKKRGDHSHTVASAWFGDEHLVLASSVDALKSALDVLDGKGGSVGSDSALAGDVPTGTTVLMRVAGIAKAELPCKNPLAKQTESIRFVVGENEGKSFLRARATMTNSEVVGQVNEILEGGQALAKLCSSDNELKLRMVKGLQIKPDGNNLTLVWNGSAEDVWQHVEAESKKWEEMRAKMGEHRRKHGRHGGDDHKRGDRKKKNKDAPKKESQSEEDNF